jgi:predicted AlkP superfamily phosphohydrolase/phosphomutase
MRLSAVKTRARVATRLTVVAAILLWPAAGHAYVGPGAGFAVLSSFLALFLAFLYSLFALVTWPVRQLLRLRRRRRAYARARVKRVVIMGFDGMEPELAEKWMREGKMPNFARMRDAGTFTRLATTCPPISPVAWSTFLTGVNPGKHNIYDFLARDPTNYLPVLSSAEIRDPRRTLRIGRYRIPLGRPHIKLLRKGKPFWHFLGEAGVFCSVIRVPITFPPERFRGVLISGMCVPDLKGTQGTFAFYSTRPDAITIEHEGVRIPIDQRDGALESYLPGPENTLRTDSRAELRVTFRVRPDAARRQAELEIDGQRFTLKLGEYSEWIELKFRPGLGINIHGICRFFLKEVAPHFELYATPINIHPARPALPISHPFTYSVYLSKLFGPYSTLGLAEDTWALNEHALDDKAFLEQCYLIHEERERVFFDALAKTPQGVCVCVFDITDRVQHMFWRDMVEQHPARKSNPTDSGRTVIEDMYRRMDALLGRVFEQVDGKTLVIVLSDHGFKSFERSVNLNSWLAANGYLALKDGARESADWYAGVDWSRTRAYAFGLNGIYVNQKGRERDGIVAAGADTEQLKNELRQKLTGLVDPHTGRVAIREVFDRCAAYSGPYGENAPDLIIGYAEGHRAAWDAVTGKTTQAIFEDNCKAWSGDHCIDPHAVPGVLFSNRKISAEDPSIADIAPTVLGLFGLKPPAHFDGKPLQVDV